MWSSFQGQLYYTEIIPLIREAQLIVNTAWQKSSPLPEWLDRLEVSTELEAPLHTEARADPRAPQERAGVALLHLDHRRV